MLLIILLIWSIVEAQLFRVKEIWIRNKKINKEVKIVFISDLHYGGFYLFNRLKRIINCINKIKPDIIIIGGDLFGNSKTSKFKEKDFIFLFSKFKELKAEQGIFAVLGNHDYYTNCKEKNFEELYRACNIKLLKNEAEIVKIQKDSIGIYGTDDFLQGRINYDNFTFQQDIFKLIVSHNPDEFENINFDFDLGLSGHTHGGQINLFGFFAPISESRYGQKYIRRINKKGAATIITSKGLGCSMLPFRFFSFPEIVSIKLTK